MIGIILKAGSLPTLDKFFERAPLMSSLMAYHLGFAPRRIPRSGYIEQVFHQISQHFLQGEQIMFLLDRADVEEGYLMPVCGLVTPCEHAWRIRVSLCYEHDVDMDRYFEAWLQRLCIYARRTGPVTSIYLEPSQHLRPVLKLYSGSETMRFNAQRNVYVIPLQ